MPCLEVDMVRKVVLCLVLKWTRSGKLTRATCLESGPEPKKTILNLVMVQSCQPFGPKLSQKPGPYRFVLDIRPEKLKELKFNWCATFSIMKYE